jgi:4a-hydroxytetrahydrobiopterin dehydratase
MDLTSKPCVPCSEGTPPLSEERAKELSRDVPGWTLAPGEPRLEREFTFPEFAPAIAFVHKVAQVAEKEGHHPDIHIHYNKVKLVLWTHSIGGLSENDFIVAAKINALDRPKKRKKTG